MFRLRLIALWKGASTELSGLPKEVSAAAACLTVGFRSDDAIATPFFRPTVPAGNPSRPVGPAPPDEIHGEAVPNAVIGRMGIEWSSSNARGEAGLRSVRIHDPRHKFGSRLRAVGMPSEDREALLHHAGTRAARQLICREFLYAFKALAICHAIPLAAMAAASKKLESAVNSSLTSGSHKEENSVTATTEQSMGSGASTYSPLAN